jgi:hypothetical protein
VDDDDSYGPVIDVVQNPVSAHTHASHVGRAVLGTAVGPGIVFEQVDSIEELSESLGVVGEEAGGLIQGTLAPGDLVGHAGLMPRRRLTSAFGMVRSCPVAFSAWYWASASWSSRSASSWAEMMTADG